MKVLVSACLLGCNCKYNGGNNLNSKVMDYLKDKEVIETCPEVLAGLGVPRTPVELVAGRIMDQNGNDVHEQFTKGVNLTMEQIKDEEVDLAILQSRSPTCGVNQIYDGTFSGKLIKGSGLLAQALVEAGYQVIDSDDVK